MNNILKEIWNLENKVNRAYEYFSKRNNLSSIEMSILYHLESNHNITQKDLVKDLVLPKQTVNTILTKWKNEDIIDLRYENGNKKEKHIYFTNKGLDFMNHNLREIYLVEENIINKMGLDNAKKLLELNLLYLNKMKEAIKEYESSIKQED